MSPTASQQWARRMRASDQHIRVSDADRNAVAELLSKHYADGRLDQGEFDERVGQTMAAKTRGDLTGLFDDLPDVEDPSGAPGPGAGPSGPAVPYRPQRPRGFLRTLLMVVLVIVAANIALHAVGSLFFLGPLTWGLLIIAAVVLVSRSRRRRGQGGR